jgi:hypothetical protein
MLPHILFTDDLEGFRARDYLGKIVNIEFSIGRPPGELATKMLGDALNPLMQRMRQLQPKVNLLILYAHEDKLDEGLYGERKPKVSAIQEAPALSRSPLRRSQAWWETASK